MAGKMKSLLEKTLFSSNNLGTYAMFQLANRKQEISSQNFNQNCKVTYYEYNLASLCPDSTLTVKPTPTEFLGA
jgi:hypothetical protein